MIDPMAIARNLAAARENLFNEAVNGMPRQPHECAEYINLVLAEYFNIYEPEFNYSRFMQIAEPRLEY